MNRPIRKQPPEPADALYLATPADSFFFHIPFLVNAGERFDENDLAERAGGFLGFYLKNGVSGDAAKRDFQEKIRQHLSNPALSSFIQEDDFHWKVVCFEDALKLWRLYAILHTVLLKSENSKIGFAVLMYDDLMNLLTAKLGEVRAMLAKLSEKQRYAALLMLNGVQLETILPGVRDRGEKDEGLASKLEALGLPILTHNQGKEGETTLIEERGEANRSSEHAAIRQDSS
jgi:hypothetical protein